METRRLFYNWLQPIYFSVLLFLCFKDVKSFMDMEELKSVYYGLSILNEPVVIQKEMPVGAVQVTSKYGQQYQCSFPDHSEADKKKEEEEKEAVETGIVEMLKPMQSADCLVKTKDWWTYEFCYGKSVRQFHLDDGVKGSIINLGLYESDFDWTNDTAKDERLKTTQASYHSQMYTNGDLCDLTQQPRRVEVRFVCDENSMDRLYRVEESETCVYTVTVMTSRICRHPYLKPPQRRRAVPITCNPLLTPNQFDDYMTDLNERKKLEEIKRAAEKVRLEEVEREQDAEFAARAINMEMGKDLEDALAKTAKDLLSGPPGSLFPKPDKSGKVTRESFSKMFGPSDQLWELYQKGLEMSKKSEEEMKRKLAELKKLQKDSAGKTSAGESAVTDEDDQVISQFTDEITEIKERFRKSREKLYSIKQKMATENPWKTNIETAIKEAEQQMGLKLDKGLVAGLSDTMNKLLEKLEDTEAELSTMDEEIESLTSNTEDKTTRLQNLEKNLRAGQEENTSPAAGGDVEDDQVEDGDGEIPKRRGQDLASKLLGGKPQNTGTDGSRFESSEQTDTYHDKIRSPPSPRGQNQGSPNRNQDVPSTFPLPKDPKDENQPPIDSKGDVGPSPTSSPGARREEDILDGIPKIKVKAEDSEETSEAKDGDRSAIPSNVKKALKETVMKEYGKQLDKMAGGTGKLALDNDHSYVQDQSIHVIQQEDNKGNTNRYILVLGFKNMDEEGEELEKQSTLEENYGFVYKKHSDSQGDSTAVQMETNDEEQNESAPLR